MRKLFVSFGILFICWVIVGWVNNSKARILRKADFIFPSAQIKHFSFGFNDTISDLYWLRVIQDFDVCTRPKTSSDSPRTGLNRTAHCEEDWAYHMLEVITELSPRNYAAYQAGGIMLSIVLDDIKGASKIYEKGLIFFPNDWLLNHQAGTHLMTEIGDFEKAAYYFNRAVRNGAPSWVAGLSAKLYDRIGRTEFAINNLRAHLKKYPDEKYAEPMRKKLYEYEQKLAAERARAAAKSDKKSNEKK